MTPLWMSLLTTLLFACARPGPRSDTAPPQLWSVTVQLDSALARSDGAPLGAALLPLAAVSERRAFSVRGDRALAHADGSHTTRMRILGAGDPAAGRVVDLRHFDSGEILALDWLGHAAGPGPALDVLSPIFPILSPKVPLVRPGRPGRMITAWPVAVGPDRKLRERVRTTWTHGGKARVEGRPTLLVSYRGEWETEGEDAGHRPPVAVEARGTVEGRVWLDVRDMSVVVHEFRWERRVALAYPGAEAGPLDLVQRQVLEGRAVQQEVAP